MRLPSYCQAFTISLLVLSSTVVLRAQNPGAIDQVNSADQRRQLQADSQQIFQDGDTAPEIYPGESSDVGPQSVLAVKPRRTWVEGIADSEIFHTDNVFLDHNYKQSSLVLVSTAQVALAPTPYKLWGETFAPRLGFREQWFDFFQDHSHNPAFGNYDFNAQTIFADERWIHGNWIGGAGFDYTRLMTTHSYSQFYYEYVPRWELQRKIPLCKMSSLNLAYQGFYHFTRSSTAFFEPQASFYDRLDQVALATLDITPCEHFLLQPYYSFKYTHLTSVIKRDDYLHSFGASAYFLFNKNISLRGFVGYDVRHSTLTIAEYKQFDAGGGLNLDIRF